MGQSEGQMDVFLRLGQISPKYTSKYMQCPVILCRYTSAPPSPPPPPPPPYFPPTISLPAPPPPPLLSPSPRMCCCSFSLHTLHASAARLGKSTRPPAAGRQSAVQSVPGTAPAALAARLLSQLASSGTDRHRSTRSLEGGGVGARRHPPSLLVCCCLSTVNCWTVPPQLTSNLPTARRQFQFRLRPAAGQPVKIFSRRSRPHHCWRKKIEQIVNIFVLLHRMLFECESVFGLGMFWSEAASSCCAEMKREREELKYIELNLLFRVSRDWSACRARKHLLTLDWEESQWRRWNRERERETAEIIGSKRRRQKANLKREKLNLMLGLLLSKY